MQFELYIRHGDRLYRPNVENGVKWSTERQGSPSILAFTAIDDGRVQFTEGDAVRLEMGGVGVFYGFIFSRCFSKDKRIRVKAYDQLRYLKNKDTYVYENKTASQVVTMVCNDYGLKKGSIKAASYIIPSRVEDNKELFDVVQNALDLELQNKGQMLVLYDDFGSLTLKSIENMKVPILIDAETAEAYDYQSSIDNNTYNQIKLFYDNKTTGKREIYLTKDSSHINEWGLLQFYEALGENENGQAKAEALLSLYNEKTRSLKITNAVGDVRCRAGAMVVVRLDVGDIKIQNWMLIEKAIHNISNDMHLMDLTLRGGEISG